MKAFLSYSIKEEDQYFITLLSRELKNKRFIVSQSSDFSTTVSPLTDINIKKSQLFIAIISGTGSDKRRVLQEFRKARSHGIPIILLIEKTVRMGNLSNALLDTMFIQFDRNKPDEAINKLKQLIDRNNSLVKKDSNVLAWVLGGAAVLAIIGLLFSDD